MASLKIGSCHNFNFVVTGGTTGCHNGNLRCHQRQQIWHHVHSWFSVNYHITYPPPVCHIISYTNFYSLSYCTIYQLPVRPIVSYAGFQAHQNRKRLVTISPVQVSHIVMGLEPRDITICPAHTIFNLISNLAKFRMLISNSSRVQSPWNFVQSTGLLVPCSVLNFKVIGQRRRLLRTNEISRDLSSR